jgi:predicted MFS family arabinose efflux permease
MYLGFSLGAAVGGFTVIHATVTDLGWVGAACELAALTLFLKTRTAARAQGTPADERTSPCAST